MEGYWGFSVARWARRFRNRKYLQRMDTVMRNETERLADTSTPFDLRGLCGRVDQWTWPLEFEWGAQGLAFSHGALRSNLSACIRAVCFKQQLACSDLALRNCLDTRQFGAEYPAIVGMTPLVTRYSLVQHLGYHAPPKAPEHHNVRLEGYTPPPTPCEPANQGTLEVAAEDLVGSVAQLSIRAGAFVTVNGTRAPFPLVRPLAIVAGKATALTPARVQITDACWEMPEPLASPPPPPAPADAKESTIPFHPDTWHFSERRVALRHVPKDTCR